MATKSKTPHGVEFVKDDNDELHIVVDGLESFVFVFVNGDEQESEPVEVPNGARLVLRAQRAPQFEAVADFDADEEGQAVLTLLRKRFGANAVKVVDDELLARADLAQEVMQLIVELQKIMGAAVEDG